MLIESTALINEVKDAINELKTGQEFNILYPRQWIRSAINAYEHTLSLIEIIEKHTA